MSDPIRSKFPFDSTVAGRLLLGGGGTTGFGFDAARSAGRVGLFFSADLETAVFSGATEVEDAASRAAEIEGSGLDGGKILAVAGAGAATVAGAGAGAGADAVFETTDDEASEFSTSGFAGGGGVEF